MFTLVVVSIPGTHCVHPGSIPGTHCVHPGSIPGTHCVHPGSMPGTHCGHPGSVPGTHCVDDTSSVGEVLNVPDLHHRAVVRESKGIK